MLCNEMIVFHMDTYEWVKISLKQSNMMPTFVQGGVCSVVPPRGSQGKEGVTVRKVRFSDGLILFRATKFWKVFTISEVGAKTVNFFPTSCATSSLLLLIGRSSTANSSTLRAEARHLAPDSATR